MGVLGDDEVGREKEEKERKKKESKRRRETRPTTGIKFSHLIERGKSFKKGTSALDCGNSESLARYCVGLLCARHAVLKNIRVE